jgi:hypothetical protein
LLPHSLRTACAGWLRTLVALGAALLPLDGARGEGVGRGALPFIRATRLLGGLHLDGRLGDPAWRQAAPFDGFVQIFPVEGAPPGEATEVRVLYDDRYLYVGVVCSDSRPGEILRSAGWRDNPPFSDSVLVLIDSNHDGTAYAFKLTAGGVQQDGLYYDDDQYTSTWDAVWDGVVAMRPDGWSAEFRIPIAVLRFGEAPEQTWGFGIRREVGRTHELISSVLIQRNARGLVSRQGLLGGLTDLKPVRDIELTPYAAARLALRPQWSDPSKPGPRLLDPILDAGLDLRLAVTPWLTLNGTVNPDFGQVEDDEVIQNLSTYELKYPEKRPFFTQGLDLFQPVGTGDGEVPQQLFYSRRIGLQTPILAAAKLTGRVSAPLQVGLLDSVVMGASDDRQDRQLRWHPEQPLHLSPGDTYPPQAPARQNFFAGTVKWQPAATATLGATFTSAAPLAEACPAWAACGNALGIDWNLRTRDSEWAFYGQADASQVVGSTPDRTFLDGIVLRNGDTGAGFYGALKRQGGEPWRVDLRYEYASPRLDLNASGFQRTQNRHGPTLVLRYVRPSGGGPFLSYGFDFEGQALFTTDGRALNRGNLAKFHVEAQLKDFTQLSCDTGLNDPHDDVREIRQSGTPYRRLAYAFLQCSATTDPSRPLGAELFGTVGRYLAWGPLRPYNYGAGQATVIARPHPSLETRLGLDLEYGTYPGKYIPGLVPGVYAFGDLVSPVMSIVLRQMAVLTPRLTLQLYAQLYTDYGRYQRFFQVVPTGAPIRPNDLQPLTPSGFTRNPDFHTTALNVNLVARWEYRLGSTLFLVYDRQQRESPWEGPSSPPADLAPRALGPGPTVDTVTLKWTYWWNP